MASDLTYVQYVCDQISFAGSLRYRKMFGEYMVYVDNKPALLICDNTAYVKMLEQLEPLLSHGQKGIPYPGAKMHYILDIDDTDLCREVLSVLVPLLTVPAPRKKKMK